MKRNINKLKGNYFSELYARWFIKKNTGAYGVVAMPAATDAINVRASSSVVPEKMDEQSEVKTNRRVRYKSKRMREKSKVVLDLDLDASGAAATAWPADQLLEVLFGKKTTVGSTQGASVALTDSKSVVAGLTITTAGTLLGFPGNRANVKFTLAGSSGTATIADSDAPNFIVSYYADSTVEDVVSAINGHADLVCAADANGDDTTDLFSALLAANALSSGSIIHCAGGAEAGIQYDNSEDPSLDLTILQNREKVGSVIAGFIPQKFSLEFSEKSPVMKIEGEAKYALLVGICGISSNVSSANKIYIDDHKQFGDYNEEAEQHIDILNADGKTYLYENLKVTGKGFDTGWYITVSSNVTCTTSNKIAYHEPAAGYNPKINPLNGLSGHLKIDGETFTDVRNVKIEWDNAPEIFENHALKSTIAGYASSKFAIGKVSATVLARKDQLGLFQKLCAGETILVPVEIKSGNTAGKQLTATTRFVEFKAPDLSDKAENVQEIELQGTILADPEADNVPSIALNTH